MPFMIRPYRRFPVCCPASYHAGLSRGSGTIWNILCPGGVCREISRYVSDRRAHCVSPCQTPNGSLSWLGWSDGCEVRSTELKRMLRMRPLKHGWCTICGTLHTNVCGLFPEQQSSQTPNLVP